MKTPAQINLGPLANNGGPTLTMAPILPSAVVDTGDNAVCPTFRSAWSVTTRRCHQPADQRYAMLVRSKLNAAAPFTAWVTELAKATYRLENVTTFPTSALNSWSPDIGFDANGQPLANNTNGGAANVNLNVAGGAANQTTVGSSTARCLAVSRCVRSPPIR